MRIHKTRPSPCLSAPDTYHIRPGAEWHDTQGKPIQAHGGGLIEHDNAVYWFGEDKAAATTQNAKGVAKVPFLGVRCYRSTDMIRWEPRGRALAPVDSDPAHSLHPTRIVERPKVLFDPIRERFVMWFKAGSTNYETMQLGVAVSREIEGPYELISVVSPHGERAGDFAIVRETDGNPYLLHPARRFSQIVVTPLDDTATRCAGPPSRVLDSEGGYDGHEAPAPFYCDGQWHMLTSRVSGWKPNPCRVSTADRLSGPWRVLGELCDPDETPDTFASQPACVWPLDVARRRFIYIGDRWRPEDLGRSGYIWLPLSWRAGRPVLHWHDAWRPETPEVWANATGENA